ncbi:oxidoreductase [Teichococcus vastitatis]|uniref:Oxidoreductase n=1 Tax=Teichococcus vastitatis TaxID=2307076 RepID=A0ABS9W613_9PROT|nr:oxidoreductase [Pseudoroseomonas vastitatis]MCI0754729.1 oxidoreductase [Pseudoroseomonas vastitatis]
MVQIMRRAALHGSEEPVRVGLIGYGFAGRIFHAPLITATPGLQLKAVMTRRTAAAGVEMMGAALVPDPQQLIARADVDVVVIATPNDSHAPLARAALLAGKHVVVEKPFALNLPEAEELAALAARQELMLTVFHNRRWDSDFLTLREVVRRGDVGRPVQLESHFDRFRPEVLDRWRERGPGSGLWNDLGSHLVDQAVQLFGRPRALLAELASMRDGAQADDYVHAVLIYDRLRVILHATALAAAPPPRFVLHGTEGSFVIHGLDPQEEALKAGTIPGSSGWGLGTPDGRLIARNGEHPVSLLAGNYRAFYEGLRDAVRGEAGPPVSLAGSLEVMRLLDAGRESNAGGCRVMIKDAP